MKTGILILFSTVLFSCTEAQEVPTGNQSTEIVQSITKDVTVSEFKELIKKEGVILDVRTPDEYVSGHIKDAKNIDVLASSFAVKVAELDKTKPVYVYCKSGGRSTRAIKQMEEMGFTSVYNLVGGYSSWSADGLPTVK